MATLTMPRMKPACAMPAPWPLPSLISRLAIWPRMIAGIPAKMPKHRMLRMPSTSAAIALPLLPCCGNAGCP